MELGTVIPQIDSTEPSKNPDAAALALTGDTATDLANIAKEMGVSLDKDGNVATSKTVAQPAVVTHSPAPTQPQAAQVPVVNEVKPEVNTEVPAKFQNPDGTLNEEKLNKSTKSAEEMIAYYRAKEREAQQIQNRVNNPAPVNQARQEQVPVQAQTQLTPLEIQMANDLLTESANYGSPITQGQAIAQARVMARGLEAKHAAELNVTADLRAELEDGKRSRELQGLMDADRELMTPEMADRLWKIRQDNPEIDKAQFPWRKAYIHHLGEQEIQRRSGQVKTPNPTGQAAQVPPTPVGPVTRVQPTVNLADPKSLTNEQLEEQIRKMYPRYRGINK